MRVFKTLNSRVHVLNVTTIKLIVSCASDISFGKSLNIKGSESKVSSYVSKESTPLLLLLGNSLDNFV